jgi:hypothetical protein
LTFRNKCGIIFIENKKRGIDMKFIHAVVFDKDEFENGHYDPTNWDDLCDGDYIVHCLYDVDNERIIIHDDNTHKPVEAMIENFLDGIEYANSTNVGGIMIPNEKIIVKKAGVVVNEGKSPYDSKAVIPHLGLLAKAIDWEAN